MDIDDQIRRKFHSLIQEGQSILSSHGWDGSDFVKAPDDASYYQFRAESLNIIKRVCGENSSHCLELNRLAESERGKNKYGSIQLPYWLGVVQAAQKDFEGGYLFNLRDKISGELFGDFVGLAKAALKQKHKEPAAVLACAALEDALKSYAEKHDLDVDDKVMQEVVKALKSKGLVSGAQKSLLGTMPKIRDYAMHANWEKITEQDVGSVIGFVEQFLLTNF